MEHCIIAIGREFGSGGHKIGQMVADRLGIPYYDKELLALAAEYGNIDMAEFERHDEKKHNNFLFEVNYSGNERVEKGKSKEETLYQLQKKVILDIADTRDAVIVGRSADDILKKAGKNVIRVFVSAPEQYRIKRTMELENLDEKTTSSLLRKKDKARRAFYEQRTGLAWGEASHYDLYFDTSERSFNEIADQIIKEYKKSFCV